MGAFFELYTRIHIFALPFLSDTFIMLDIGVWLYDS